MLYPRQYEWRPWGSSHTLPGPRGRSRANHEPHSNQITLLHVRLLIKTGMMPSHNIYCHDVLFSPSVFAMFSRTVPAMLLASLVTHTASATSPPDELLQPRDLDGNTDTIEAYYDSQQNITWLADTNLGLTETFGLQRGTFTDLSLEIHASGEMRQQALSVYLQGMNQNVYLGQSHWRLPVAQSSGDSTCSVQSNGMSSGTNCSSAEIPALFVSVLNRYGSIENSPFENLNSSAIWLGSFGSAGRHRFQFSGSGNLFSFPARLNPVGKVWPVHDGDIGSPVLQPSCIDTDGDGWGWDGTASCVASAPPIAECIDSDGDGWGWNGRKSCRIEIITHECIELRGVFNEICQELTPSSF